MDLFELAKQFGPFAAFTVYFVWQGWQREKRQDAKINHLQEQLSELSTKVIVDSTTALTAATQMMGRMEQLMMKYCPAGECDGRK